MSHARPPRCALRIAADETHAQHSCLDIWIQITQITSSKSLQLPKSIGTDGTLVARATGPTTGDPREKPNHALRVPVKHLVLPHFSYYTLSFINLLDILSRYSSPRSAVVPPAGSPPHPAPGTPHCPVQAAWQLIKDMVVRGAPAIAITGALALAVELRGRLAGPGFASEAAAVDFIVATLDFLVSSRPTAVNLHDAATKIKAHTEARKGEGWGEGEGPVRCTLRQVDPCWSIQPGHCYHVFRRGSWACGERRSVLREDVIRRCGGEQTHGANRNAGRPRRD